MIKNFYFLAQTLVDPGSVAIPKPKATESQVSTMLSLVFMVAGAVAVLVIIVAGISYILSAGDPQKTARAKDAILYAVIGLAVAILANVIVAFVLGKIFG